MTPPPPPPGASDVTAPPAGFKMHQTNVTKQKTFVIDAIRHPNVDFRRSLDKYRTLAVKDRPHAPGSVAPFQVDFQPVLSCALSQAVAVSRPTVLRSAFSWSPHLRLGLPLGLDQPAGVAALSRLAASRGGSALAK
ncbi:hypothetical protein Bbelb_089320 [Branchiostoma belcheri]|nr:hypothetical protein Bbelb_089320 [Branchiostoma belcheri]